MVFALTGARVFDGVTIRENLAVVIKGALITHVIPQKNIPRTIEQRNLLGGILAPGFIDLQVNGGGGALLNDHPTIETVKRIAAAHRRFGITGMLPTVITDMPQILVEALAAVKQAYDANIPGILGIHIEGPFLDLARKGAHDAQFIRTMTNADVEHIANADCGVVMLTLAPNRVPVKLIQQLAERGVLVSLGHSDASFLETRSALHAGARSFTHIFNAMSQMNGREPGMVGAALSDANSYCGLIADGLHVHDATMKAAVAAKGKTRIMLVSDAMPTAAGGPDHFNLQGRMVRREEGRLSLEDGTLAGSNLTLDEAVRYCVNQLGISIEDALCMASLTPAQFIRADHQLGRIQEGYLANLVHLTDDLTVLETWIDGK